MWNRLQKPLVVLSIGLNLAFIAVWLFHAVQGPEKGQRSSTAEHEVSSSLHRKIGVTPEQWEKIEPYVQSFREKTKEQRHKNQALRCQLLDLLIKPTVDKTALEAKQKELCAGSCRMKWLAIELLLKEKDVLTPEQHNSLIKEIQQKPGSHRRKGQHGGGFMGLLCNDKSPKKDLPN